jgi:hypothetical protein
MHFVQGHNPRHAPSDRIAGIIMVEPRSDVAQLVQQAVTFSVENNCEVAFAHVFLPSPFSDVLAVCRALDCVPKTSVTLPVFIGQSLGSISRVWYAAEVRGGTIIWATRIELPQILALSRQLGCELHWISVSAEMQLWGYMSFEGSEPREVVLDPESLWRENRLSADDLRGKGVRRFATLTYFLESIASSYLPVDVVWNYQRWADVDWRQSILKTGHGVGGCYALTLATASTPFSVCPIGGIALRSRAQE